MGNQQHYIEEGGFDEYLYRTHERFPELTINGIKCKVILLGSDPQGKHYSLPAYSNTSDMYFKVDKDGRIERYSAARKMSADEVRK